MAKNYGEALNNLYGFIGGWNCADTSSPDAILSSLTDWPAGTPLPTVQALEDEATRIERSVRAKAKLADIDFRSMRSIREWVAKQADAPQVLKDFEVQAVSERGKV